MDVKWDPKRKTFRRPLTETTNVYLTEELQKCLWLAQTRCDLSLAEASMVVKEFKYGTKLDKSWTVPHLAHVMSRMQTMSEESRNPESPHHGDRSYWKWVFRDDHDIEEQIRVYQDTIDNKNIKHEQDKDGTVLLTIKYPRRKFSHEQQKFIYHALITEGSSEEAISEALTTIAPKKPKNINLRMFSALVRYMEMRSNKSADTKERAYWDKIFIKSADTKERAYWDKLFIFDHWSKAAIHKLIASKDRKPNYASTSDRRYLPRSLRRNQAESDAADRRGRSKSHEAEPHIEIGLDGILRYLPAGSSNPPLELSGRQQKLVYFSHQYYDNSSELTIRLLRRHAEKYAERYGERMPHGIQEDDIEQIVQLLIREDSSSTAGITSNWLTENIDFAIAEIPELKAQINSPRQAQGLSTTHYPRPPTDQVREQPQPNTQGLVSHFGKIARGSGMPRKIEYNMETAPERRPGHEAPQYPAEYGAAGYTSATGSAGHGPRLVAGAVRDTQDPAKERGGKKPASHVTQSPSRRSLTPSDASHDRRRDDRGDDRRDPKAHDSRRSKNPRDSDSPKNRTPGPEEYRQRNYY